MPNADEGYRGPQVCKFVGITYRQLDYWARTKLVEPGIRPAEGSGSQRLYSFTDIVHLKIIKSLLDAGVSLQQTRKAVDYLRTELKQPIAHIPIPLGPSGGPLEINLGQIFAMALMVLKPAIPGL